MTFVKTNIVFLALLLTATTNSFAKNDDFVLPKTTITQTFNAQGQGNFRKFGFKIFKAQLWTTSTTTANTLKPPYALQLKYARNIKSKRIVDASIKEMTKQQVTKTNLSKWQTELTKIIPNVNKGDVITGVNTGNASAFYYNGKPIGTVKNPQFGTDFFGIWLKPNTSEPKLRKQLLKLK